MSNTEVPRTADTPLYLKKEQKINDRLHDKINVLKSQASFQQDPPRQPLQPAAKDQLKLKEFKDSVSVIKRGKDSEGSRKDKENRRELMASVVPGEKGKDSRIAHNNWIISNQVLKETSGLNSQKQPSSKSVIVVKPNHCLQPSESQVQQHRGSLKKAASERKPDKDENTSTFYLT